MSRVFFGILSPESYLKEYHRRRVNGFLRFVTIGEESRLTETAMIHNQVSKADKIVIGKRSIIEGELQVFKLGGHISIGDYCYIGRDSRIWSRKNIFIGDNVFISHNVNIMDTNAHTIEPFKRAAIFRGDMEDLRVIPPKSYIGAVEAIPLVTDAIAVLKEKDSIYPVGQDLYFKVTSDEFFGERSHYSQEKMLQIFAERGGDPLRTGKMDPLDCLVWMSQRPNEPGWESPLGKGRPG